MGSDDADPTLLYSSGMKRCPPVFQGSLGRMSFSVTAAVQQKL